MVDAAQLALCGRRVTVTVDGDVGHEQRANDHVYDAEQQRAYCCVSGVHVEHAHACAYGGCERSGAVGIVCVYDHECAYAVICCWCE